MSKSLLLVGCVHAGARTADIDLFQLYIKKANQLKCEILLLGDLFENAIPARGEGMMYEQNLTPEEQIDRVAAILDPVKGQIIGCCTSNHSFRTYKEVGLNMDRILIKQLGLSNSLYKGEQGIVVWNTKKIAFAHGNGAGFNTWADARKLLAIYPGVDVCAVSHRHNMAAEWAPGHFKINERGDRIQRDTLFIRTGSLLKYPKYAERELYSPNKIGFSSLQLSEKGVLIPDITGGSYAK